MTNNWWTRDASLTTENEDHQWHSWRRNYCEWPSKEGKICVVGFGVGCLNWKYYVLWYSTCTYNIMCMSIILLCTVHVCVIMRRTELLIAKNITPSYMYMYTIYTHVYSSLVTQLILSCSQNSSVSLKAAGEKVRITLKEIETLLLKWKCKWPRTPEWPTSVSKIRIWEYASTLRRTNNPTCSSLCSFEDQEEVCLY